MQLQSPCGRLASALEPIFGSSTLPQAPAYARAVAILEDWDKSGQPVLEP